ncbi:MAG: hypothetical protein ACFFDT_24900, partial [Candidatus Hodarchaeota archaeon]
IQTNRYQEILWFNQEAFENLVRWLFIISLINIVSDPKMEDILSQEIERIFRMIHQWLTASKRSNFQVVKLIELLSREEFPSE